MSLGEPRIVLVRKTLQRVVLADNLAIQLFIPSELQGLLVVYFARTKKTACLCLEDKRRLIYENKAEVLSGK